MTATHGLTVLERLMFWRVITGDGCWEWSASCNQKGYGRMHIAGIGTRSVHRVAWEQLRGSIPEDRPEIDHLCRNRSCFNPAHLEPVTKAENERRKAESWTVCRRGHDLTQPGAIHYRKNWTPDEPRGARECASCKALSRLKAVS